MATINICDLRSTGSELFSDSESYMNELGDSEVHTIHGGFSSPGCAVLTIVSLSVAIASPLIIATAAEG